MCSRWAWPPSVALSLVVQVGEQVDFLRFLPEKHARNRRQWWSAVLVAGPGGVIPGMLKMLAGAFLAFPGLQRGCPERPSGPHRCTWRASVRCSTRPRGARRHGGVCHRVAGQDQRHQCLRRLAGLVQLRLPDSRTATLGEWWLVFNVVICRVADDPGRVWCPGHVLALQQHRHPVGSGLVADLVINKPRAGARLALSSNALSVRP